MSLIEQKEFFSLMWNSCWAWVDKSFFGSCFNCKIQLKSVGFYFYLFSQFAIIFFLVSWGKLCAQNELVAIFTKGAAKSKRKRKSKRDKDRKKKNNKKNDGEEQGNTQAKRKTFTIIR